MNVDALIERLRARRRELADELRVRQIDDQVPDDELDPVWPPAPRLARLAGRIDELGWLIDELAGE
jgi:hypothetical protein